MRRRNPDAGLVVFWVKLMQRGYSRSIPGLYRFLRKQGIMAVHSANPKYVAKTYEQMTYPGQRIQIDVKSVPSVCLVNEAKGKKLYQYTAIDEYSRWLFVEDFEEYSSYPSTQFLQHLIRAFPMPIECVQTDNGMEFTKRFSYQVREDNLTMFEKELVHHRIQHKLIRPFPLCPCIMEKWNAAIGKIMNAFMQPIPFIPLTTSQNNFSTIIGETTTISLCVL
ncbi:DDE-type integrase/transposase/recombinase [Petralouisia muris]|uniref:DDE-type integrase/transposase/recombinase n=1 Tax=Petralouisia muris TaxID=3032872 RepID=UPI0023B823F8|nr:DDE-type integrase/transposase/recombinase [Petralouisia muris]